jgi:hypothetical protein
MIAARARIDRNLDAIAVRTAVARGRLWSLVGGLSAIATVAMLVRRRRHRRARAAAHA